MIDVHAHINTKNFPPVVFQDMLKSAKEKGVKHIVSVSESIQDAKDIILLAKQSNGMIWPSIGLHPVQNTDQQLERSVTMEDWEAFKPLLEKVIADKTIVCVGEVGLDFSRHIIQQNENNLIQSEQELKQIQCDVFKAQVEMAVKADLPLNVHSRNAGHYALSILYECGAKLVNMHAFDGKASYTKKAINEGYYFSIPPSMIRLSQQEALAKNIPLTSLLLESDSPALGPEKGVDNEPKNIFIAAQGISRVKNIPIETVVEQTTLNALKLFKTA
ncbi:putative deoxyribonuclease TATDN3-like protein [Cunninghamella echinulata]|nr:putative deoxyribonuclease TATDN3-like protein [Cunninghamella echinulata]